MTVSDVENVVLRPPARMVVRGAVVALVGVVPAAAAVAVYLTGISPVWVRGVVPWGVVLAVIGLGRVVLALRGFTVAGPQGVRYRRMGRQVEVPWREFQRFEAGSMPWGRGVYLVCTDGRSVGLAAPRGRRSEDAAFEATVAALEAVAARYRAEPDGAAPSAEVLVRRLSWRLVLPYYLAIGVFGVAIFAFGVVAPLPSMDRRALMLGFAAFVLAMLLFAMFTDARARTVVGPQGITNRQWWTSTTIPWAEISEVVVDTTTSFYPLVKIRRGERMVFLAGLRGKPRGPDPHFDETVAAIRSAIEAHHPVRDGGGAGPAVHGYPMSLRPPRRPLILVIPLIMAAIWVIAQSLAPPTGVVLGILPALSVYWAFHVVLLLTGRTDIDGQGITNRRILRRRSIPWTQVEGLEVMFTLFGRVVRVTPKGGPKAFSLAAPREGLLARDTGFDASVAELDAHAAAHRLSVHPPSMPRRGLLTMLGAVALMVVGIAAWVDQPWERPWWPGLHEASTITEPCALPEAGELFGGPVTQDADRSPGTWSCGWTEVSDGEVASVDVTYERFSYRVQESGTDQAREEFDRERDQAADEGGADVADLGAEALRTTDVTGTEEDTATTLVVRKANVLVTVNYDGPAAQAEDTTEQLARAALDRVRLE